MYYYFYNIFMSYFLYVMFFNLSKLKNIIINNKNYTIIVYIIIILYLLYLMNI